VKKLRTHILFAVLSSAVLIWFALGWVAYHTVLHRTEVWSISDTYRGDPVTVRASDQFAGAIFSVTWRGVEFIDAFDHGRQLQSAAQFNGLRECYNPTEAGANADGGGRWSSSRLMSVAAKENQLETRTRMAFWLAPGEASPSCPGGARNTAALSDHAIAKTVTISKNVIANDVTFHVPRSYERADFEAVTAYLPAQFDTFWSYDPKADVIKPLSTARGSQATPLVISTKDRRFALGVYSPSLPQQTHPHSGYGWQRFQTENVSKWSCVYRLRNVQAGQYAFRCYAIVGSLDDVVATIRVLADGASSSR
jgi:hypothetical protein